MCIMCKMSRLVLSGLPLILAFIVMFALGSPAFSRESGLAELLHTLKKERGKTCMVGHYHHGASRGQKSEKLALRAAKRSWMSFVAFEYGYGWASFRNSANKGKKCEKSGDGYGCSVSARPCKKGK